LTYIERTIEIKKEPLEIFQYVVDLEKRTEWNQGLDDFKYDKDEINQVETTHTCVINGRNVDFKSFYSKSEGNEFIWFEETESIPVLKRLISVIEIEKKGYLSLVRSRAYLEHKNFLFKLFIPLFKRKFEKNLEESLAQLKDIFR